ncbi:MAG: hypothetical protein LBJ00_18285 [Planctomycetaceae bacterium]|nr:hypothetical protein [Planctomycetaceae bacterium]
MLATNPSKTTPNFRALYSGCFKAGHASVASRSGCSRAKPIALPATV